MSLIVGVIAVLYLGVATPTEAAAVATLVAMIMSWQRGRLGLDTLREVLLETVRISAFLLFIVIGASVLSFVFDYLRLPTLLVEAVKAAQLSPGIVLLAIAVPYVILGMFVDPISMMVMTLPVLFPLVVAMGFDPVWFGIILVLLVEIGLIFPPIGMNLTVLRSIGGEAVTLRQIVLGALPFMAVMAAFIWLLYLVPGLVTWLPRTMS
jgi:tripartite ATP-independent transporter DctM subunit